jgi:sulfur carrier protein
MRIYVNGSRVDIAEQMTVAGLIAEKGLNPSTVVIEHNLNILSKEKWATTQLSAEDRVEIVAFVGGG